VSKPVIERLSPATLRDALYRLNHAKCVRYITSLDILIISHKHCRTEREIAKASKYEIIKVVDDMTSKNVEELERLYLGGKEQAEQFKLLFDDVVPSRAYKDRVRFVGIEQRPEELPPAPERPLTVKAVKLVKKRAEEWVKSVNDMLDKIGKYKLRFNDPKEKGFKTDKSDLTKNEKELREAIDNIASRVNALREIIVDIDENNEQPREAVSEQPQQSSEKVAYELEYNSSKVELILNKLLNLTTRQYKTPDKAFQKAFKSPNTPVEVTGSMSSTIGNLKIPSVLKEIMFRCSKGTFQINPIITENNLLKHGIDKVAIDQELQKLTK
jgi:hypothetical protein